MVLILAPAWIADDRFHPLLVHADSVIVSLHLDRSLGERLQELLEYLHGLNVPVAGLMTYAGPDAAERRVDDVFDVEAGQAGQAGQAGEHPGRDGGGPDEPEPLAEPTELRPTRPPSGPCPSPRRPTGRPVTGEEQGAGEWPESRPRALEQPTDDAGGSSTVFRVVAVIALVALVAFVGWWGLSSRDDTPPVDVAVAPPPVVEDEVPEVDRPRRPSRSPSRARRDGGRDADGRRRDSAHAPGRGRAARKPRPRNPPRRWSRRRRRPEARTNSPNPSRSRPSPASPTGSATWPAPVGPGYALHVASFTDQAGARGEARRLESAHGWQPDVRSAVIDGEQWYRVLVGRFDSRADALAARAPIGGILDLDWVGVVRVR